MKKQLSFVFLLLLSFYAKSQYTPTAKSYYEKHHRPIKPGYIQFGGGMSFSVGDWGAGPTASSPVLDPFVGKDGMGAENGYFINLSMMVPLSYEADFKNKGYMGIRWGLEFANHGYLEWSEVINDAFSNYNAYNISILLGPNYNINVGNKFVVELASTLNLSIVSEQPNMAKVNFIGNNDEYSFRISAEESPEEGPALTWKPGWTLSAGIRVRKWKFYAQYYKQGIERYYTYTTYDSKGNEKVQEFNSDFSIKTFRLGIVFLFGNY